MIKKPVIRGPEEIRRDGRADVVQVEERTFHNQHGDGSQGTRDDADHEARESHTLSKETEVPRQGRSDQVEDRVSTTAVMWRRESELAWLRGRVKFRQPC